MAVKADIHVPTVGSHAEVIERMFLAGALSIIAAGALLAVALRLSDLMASGIGVYFALFMTFGALSLITGSLLILSIFGRGSPPAVTRVFKRALTLFLVVTCVGMTGWVMALMTF